MLKYKIQKYGHHDKNKETNNNNYTCFVTKNIRYHNTIQNMDQLETHPSSGNISPCSSNHNHSGNA